MALVNAGSMGQNRAGCSENTTRLKRLGYFSRSSHNGEFNRQG